MRQRGREGVWTMGLAGKAKSRGHMSLGSSLELSGLHCDWSLTEESFWGGIGAYQRSDWQNVDTGYKR